MVDADDENQMMYKDYVTMKTVIDDFIEWTKGFGIKVSSNNDEPLYRLSIG